MSRPTRPAPPGSPFFLAAALALAAVIPLLGLPVYFRTDDVHWLGWALDHPNPLAAFDPAQNLFGYYRPLPTIAWWIMARLFGFAPLGYQLVLGLVAVGAMVPLFRIGRRMAGGEWCGLLAVVLFHGLALTILYYVFWFSALTFGLELLLLLLAFDAFLDGPVLPGRPRAFVCLGLAAGLAKQPALLILPLVCGALLLQEKGPWRRRLPWIVGIGIVGLLLLVVTPFVAHRPQALSGMNAIDRSAFLVERYEFYGRWLMHGPAGPLAALAAVAGLFGRRWHGLLAGAAVGAALRFLPIPLAFPAWCLLLVAAGWRVPATRPWLLGFFLPGFLLLGVDFHVATYLLEPLVCLVPAVLLWFVPSLTAPGEALQRWRGARLPWRWAPLLPIGGALLLAGVARDRVPPLVAMRQVRASFRQGVEALLEKAPRGATIGCLTYDELGQTYADIRQRPLGERVELHKTMNPAQLEKFLRLRGRRDLRVVPLAEANHSAPPVFLFAANAEEIEALARVPGAVPLAAFRVGRAGTGLFRLAPPPAGRLSPTLTDPHISVLRFPPSGLDSSVIATTPTVFPLDSGRACSDDPSGGRSTMLCTRANRTSPLLWLAFITTVLALTMTTPAPPGPGLAGMVGMAVCEAKPAGAPRTFNLYIRKHYEAGDDTLLAKWDVLGLDMDTPDSMLVLIKAANPNCKLLAFCPINGTYDQALRFPVESKWRQVFETAAANNWWLRNTNGGQVKDHGNKFTTNLTLNCPKNAQNQSIHDWFPQFVVGTVLENGTNLWDGVLLDDCWVGIWWISIDRVLNPYPIDSNLDLVADAQSALDQSWAAGNDTILARLRRTLPANKIMTGNGQNRWYQLNGAMIETFPFGNNPDIGSPAAYSWNYTMFQDYGYFSNEDHYNPAPERMNFLNSKWALGSRYSSNQSPEYQRHKRFCLASCMLRDGYFSLDWASNGVAHNSLWWEPEYEKPIGTPLGPPYQITLVGSTLWRRDFTNGSVVLNPNYVGFEGSPTDSLPPIGYLDAAIMLKTEFWHPDVMPPPPLTTLTVVSTWPDSIQVQWTNVADDRPTTRVTNMSLRYSLSPITDANFFQAAKSLPPPVPGPTGTVQKATIRNLQPNTTYYVAARIWDEFGNGSPVSNLTSGLTVISDTTPPGSAHLEITRAGLTDADYNFMTPGDDGSIGVCLAYSMRYSTAPLTEANWAQATPLYDLPAPYYPGTRFERKFWSLASNTTYYCAFRALDDAGLWSALEPVSFKTATPGTVKRGPYNDSNDPPLPRMAAEIGVERCLALSAPQPNPTAGSSVVSMLAPEAGVPDLSVAVFDSRGRQVCVLHSGPATGGRHDFLWDGRDLAGQALPAGVYFISLRAGAINDVKKVVRSR